MLSLRKCGHYMIGFGLLVTLGPEAYGFEFSPVGEFPGPALEGKRADVLLGCSLGYDSNPGRAARGNEEGNIVLEALAGVSLVGGNTHLKYDLSAETRLERYSSLPELGYEESVLKGGVGWGTRKVRLGLTARLASLVDPVDVETFGFGSFRRTEVSCAPEASFTFGKAALGIGCRMSALDCEDSSLNGLDHDDTAGDIELRWGRPERGQGFFHFESGTVDYSVFDPLRPRYDFDCRKLYGGWRSKRARKSSIELGAGMYELRSDGFSGGDGIHLTTKATWLLQNGSSAIEAAYTRSAEAAATADFKTVSRALLRYSKKVTMSWRWSVGLRSESSKFTNPDPSTAASLSAGVLNVGFRRILGSPSGWHGRLYATLCYESGDDFGRFRLLAGVAVAH